ncbi:hypothetical protein T4E_8800 [Trichinella pseudospiralis]|uniref:Uncharacterized protein n=1 Tax=Trichinella pseudospiralis TaxID=6337 RepID=A0A0V0X2M9_TRIPS|nr:hypothetical protein T4E_8800 [Trichinella pseudospiralis]
MVRGKERGRRWTGAWNFSKVNRNAQFQVQETDFPFGESVHA